jgi:membrane protein implicated in regulation of membrane protease activity
MEHLIGLGVWNWFIVGGLLLAVELIAPGTFMLWLGLSALVVGVVSLLVAWPWQAQLVTFALLALASIPLWRRFAGRIGTADRPFLNRRAEALIGRVFMLDKPIVDGVGSIRINDSIWRVTGPDVSAGRRVRIVAVDGADLAVEPAE